MAHVDLKYALLVVGCKVNRVEIDDIGAQMDSLGAIRCADESVQVVFINTCTVTAEADKKTRKMVRGALRQFPNAHVLVMGCAVAIDPDEYLSYSDRVRIVGKKTAVREALDLLGIYDVPDEALRVGENYNTRVSLKVQDGCDNACTFCIVHVARGKSVSMPFDEVLHEAVRYGEAGVRELVLTGINLATYYDEGKDIADLMQALLDAHPGYRLRLGSVEPLDVTEKLITLMANNKDRICAHLHLPLQSGSSKVLAEMNRNYSAEFFCELVDELYAAMPSMSLSTDIIVGFPGETDEDFQRTLDVAKHARFSKIHVFRYSKRADTPAAERKDQIPPEIMANRAKELQWLGKELMAQDMQSRIDTHELVLVEQQGRGMTESYHPVCFTSNQPEVGALIDVTLPSLIEEGAFIL